MYSVFFVFDGLTITIFSIIIRLLPKRRNGIKAWTGPYITPQNMANPQANIIDSPTTKSPANDTYN